MITNFTPNETVTIIGAIVLVVITLYNIGKMILTKKDTHI